MATWKDRLNELTAAAKKTVGQARNQVFLEAMTAAFSLVAYADGVVKPEEKAKFLGFIEHSDVLSVFTRERVERLLAECDRQYAFDAGVAAQSMLNTLGKLKNRPAEARLLVRVCCAIGSADGDFDAAEQAAVVRICQALALDPTEFDLTPSTASTTPTTAGRLLARGERLPLPTLTQLGVGLNWRADSTFDIDASAFLLDSSGKVSGDEDMVFYNQPRSRCGALLLDSKPGADRTAFIIEPALLPTAVVRIAFTLTLHHAEQRRQNFAQVREPLIRLYDGANELARYTAAHDAGPETALIMGELYRHHSGWRFAAVGQGYVGGLKALCERYGVSVG